MNIILKELEQFDNFVFDFDGTLIDSEPIYCKIFMSVISSVTGKRFKLPMQTYLGYAGATDIGALEKMKKDFNLDFDVINAINLKRMMAEKIFMEDNIQIGKFFSSLHEHFPNKKYIIVSGSPERIINQVLTKNNIRHYFENIYSMTDLNCRKNDFLDVFEEKTGLNPKKCAIFEDTNNTIIHAKANGFFTVGVDNKSNHIEDADAIIKINEKCK